MLAAAYEAIKAVNPDTLVISGAPAPTGFFGDSCGFGGCDDNVFMAQMANARRRQLRGLHRRALQRRHPARPTAPTGGPTRAANTQRAISCRCCGASPGPFRNADIPMCMTEIGYLSPEGLRPAAARFRLGLDHLSDRASRLARERAADHVQL